MGCAQPRRTVLPQNHIPIEQIQYDRVPLMQSPSYVKSALKRTQFNGGRANQSPMSMPKSVNFYQTVQVRCRTPTPNKVWYEKSSTTMPMRKNPPNDDDDDDYEAQEEGYADENDDDDQRPNSSTMPRLGTPIPSQTTRQWFPTEHEFSPSPVNRIKVRQRLPPSDTPQIFGPAPTQPTGRPSFPLSTNVVAPSGGRLVQNVT